MNAPVTRRALLGATAALGVVAFPTVAPALSIPVAADDVDAELFALLDRWRDARAVWDATDDPLEEAHERAKSAYPPMPAALWSTGDFRVHLDAQASGRGVKSSGHPGSFYYPSDVETLRASPPVTRWAWADDSVQPPPRESDPEGEARRQEIIAASDRWQAERRAVEDTVGYTAAVELAETLAKAWVAIDDALALCPPRTVAGIVRKAAWVADCLSKDIGRDDLGEVFARQVAAFGSLSAVGPEPRRPMTFDAAAFLADLKAAGCRVTLEIPGTRFRGDEAPTYFIAPSRGYTAVMAKWGKAIAACPDHVAQVTARLAEMHGVNL